jgi:glycosyltransferase involved in cell wall biosynthesis
MKLKTGTCNVKILLLSPLPPPSGGIASWTFNLLEYSKKHLNGIEIYNQDTGLKYREILNDNVLYRIYYGLFEGFKIFRELKRNIKSNKPDIIHLTSTPSLALIKDYFILGIAKRNRIPLVLHWHFGSMPSIFQVNNWERKLISYIIRECSQNILIDSESYRTLAREGFANIAYIPNPVSLKLEDKIRAYTEIPVKPGKISLTFVGHVIREKGIYELVEACCLIPEIEELKIIGSFYPSVKEELEILSGKKSSNEWLKFYGNLGNDEVLEIIHNSNILILPSYTEGFPMVILEAMAMGCAVIATDVGAIPEMLAIVSDKPCGICVPPRNVGKLKEALINMISDLAGTHQMGRHGRDRVLLNYTFTQVMELFKFSWKKVLSLEYKQPD